MESKTNDYPDFWDRVCSAIGVFFAALLTGIFVWGLVLLASIAGMYNWMPPFKWVIYFSVVFSVLGFWMPEKTLDWLEKIWESIGSIVSDKN